ncbi:hypothetical protein [Sorangium sp. So ce1078]|uniref:hypothetical protein n=1 Tax=Sorangium sp. So ce1078 TaxID=3133329 RepID=UPI003F640180
MVAITEPAAGVQEAREGVSLAQYAAVRAAVSEGFPLADVLAVEGLKPRAFARADLYWKQRLAAEPELLAEFEEELARAEDWLDRPIEPLADDAGAWASFLGAFGAHPAPFELLQEKRVGMNDVARLRRRWARRAEEDTKLGELLAELRARPGELGPLRVGPQVLRPSRGAGARGPADAPTAEDTVAVMPREPGLGLAEYAALCAELEALPHQRERVLRRHGLADEEACAALARQWRAALDRDATLANDFERLEAHHAGRLEMLLARARDVADVERSTAPLSASPAPRTAPSRELMTGFMAPPVTAAALRGTGSLPDILRGAVVPFAAAERATPAGAPASSRRSPPAPAELGATSLSLKIPGSASTPRSTQDGRSCTDVIMRISRSGVRPRSDPHASHPGPVRRLLTQPSGDQLDRPASMSCRVQRVSGWASGSAASAIPQKTSATAFVLCLCIPRVRVVARSSPLPASTQSASSSRPIVSWAMRVALTSPAASAGPAGATRRAGGARRRG